MSEIKLLPCPFCGGEARIRTMHGKRRGYYVGCHKCSCRTPFFQYQFDSLETLKEKAIEAWNTRKPMEQIVERLEEEKKKYKEECSRDIDNYRQYVRRTHVNIFKFIDIVRAYGKE